MNRGAIVTPTLSTVYASLSRPGGNHDGLITDLASLASAHYHLLLPREMVVGG